MPRLRKIVGVNSYAAEWTDKDGTTFQLMAVLDGTSLTLGIKPERGSWNYVAVDYPERFTHGRPVSSWPVMRKVVQRWFEWKMPSAA